MKQIDKICRTPGFIFKKSIYEGPVFPDAHRLRVQHESFEGVGILRNQYCPPGMKFERDKPLKELIVIGYNETYDYIYLAKQDYLDTLMDFYYDPNLYLKYTPFPHLESDWMNACSKDNFNDAFRLTGKKGRIKGRRWFEVKGPMSSIVIQELNIMNDLKGPHNFFPDSFYNDDQLRSLYKTDTNDIEMPLYYPGEAIFKVAKQKVHIFLHGFTSPAKWHYGVWKHVLCLKPVGNPLDKKKWEAFENNTVTFANQNLFNKCKENDKGSSCNEKHCRDNKLFSNMHPHIRNYCHRYLKQAISFFETNALKEIEVWTNDRYTNSLPHKIIVCITNRNKSQNRLEKLILKGYCYDWDKAECPTIHLFIITLFTGKLNWKNNKKRREEKGLLIDFGQLNTWGEKNE